MDTRGVVSFTVVSFMFSLAFGTKSAADQERAKWGGAVEATNQSTVITAGTLTFDYEQHIGELEGNVHVIGKEMTIDADKIVIRFREDNQVTNIVATGNVSIKQGGGVATCATARCDVVRGEMILTGNPALARGQERMKGDIITIIQEPGTKSPRVKCVGSANHPTSLILGPGAGENVGDFRLTGEKKER